MGRLTGAICGLCVFVVLAMPGSVAAQACVGRPAGLVVWWTADGTTSDLVGGNNGTLVNGATFAAGKVSEAFAFDGSNDFVQVPDSERWAFGTRDFTIELWANFSSVRSGSLGGPERVFVGNDEGGGSQNKWFFALGGGQLNFHINGPGIGPLFFVRAAFAPAVGRWYHLVVTRSAGTYTIYVDGVAQGSEASPIAIPDANAPLTIGQAEGLGFMDGLLDELSIYDRALSPGEIQAIVAAGAAGKCKSGAPPVFGTLQVDVSCPVTAPRGSSITSSVQFRNVSAAARTVTRAAVGFHVSGMRVSGPVSVPFDVSVPAASVGAPACPFCAPPVTPSTVSATIPVLLPRDARPGSFVSLGLGFLGRVGADPARRSLGSGGCVVEITR